MLGYRMYSWNAMLMTFVFIFEASAADSQPSTSQVTSQQIQINQEWYNALEGTEKKLHQAKNDYDDYYFYSNGCAAIILLLLLKKIADKKFRVAAPSDSPSFKQPLLHTDVENQPVQRGNISTKYDEIQKRWDEKVIGAHDKTKAKYDEIQERWDHKVLGA
jgi:hypothetical protein